MSSFKFSLKNARSFAEANKLGQSIANYLAILKLQPVKRPTLEKEFLLAFGLWISELEAGGHVEKANDYFSLANDLFPQSGGLYLAWGQFLFRNGLEDEAAVCFLKVQRSFVLSNCFYLITLFWNMEPVIQILRSHKFKLAELLLEIFAYFLNISHFIDQWHFSMLNDIQRNSAYEQALSAILKTGGSGRLVLDIGAGTCLLSLLALEAGANQVVACEQSRPLCEISKRILQDNEVSEQRVRICNKHSADLKLGEDLPSAASLIVTEIVDAGFYGEGVVSTLLDAKQRLLASDGTIVPHGAQLFAALLESAYIRSENVVCRRKRGEPQPSPLIVSEYAQESTNECEPYVSHHLRSLKGDLRLLSDPILIDTVCFNDLQSLQQHADGFESNVHVTASCSGQIDGIALWFSMELSPGIVISTHINTNTAWEQAVYPVPLFTRVSPGDDVTLAVHLRSDRLKLTLSAVNQLPVVSSCTSLPVASCGYILRMNDELLLSFYAQCFASVKECDAHHASLCCSYLDISHNPRVTELLLLQASSRVVCVHGETLEKIAFNAFVEDSFGCSAEELPNLVCSLPAALEKRSDFQFDTLVCDPIDVMGLLRANVLEDITYYRLLFGIRRVVPSVLSVLGAVIESDEIFNAACVTSDSNTLGLRVKDQINVLRTPIQQDLHFSTTKHRYLTKFQQLLQIDFAQTLEPNSDCLPSILSVSKKPITFEVSAGGRAHGLVLCYEYVAEDGCVGGYGDFLMDEQLGEQQVDDVLSGIETMSSIASLIDDFKPRSTAFHSSDEHAPNSSFDQPFSNESSSGGHSTGKFKANRRLSFDLASDSGVAALSTFPSTQINNNNLSCAIGVANDTIATTVSTGLLTPYLEHSNCNGQSVSKGCLKKLTSSPQKPNQGHIDTANMSRRNAVGTNTDRGVDQFAMTSFVSQRERNTDVNNSDRLPSNVGKANVDLANAAVDMADIEKVKRSFERLHQEFGRVSRISHFSENGPSPPLADDGTALRISDEEAVVLRGLLPAQLREIWETECLKRKLCERKIALLQKQLLEKEEQLAVSQSLNAQTQESVSGLEATVNALLTTWFEKERVRIEQCNALMADNLSLSSSLKTSQDKAQRLSVDLQESQRLASQLQDQFSSTKAELERVESARQGSLKELSATTSLKEKLAARVDSLETERLQWFEKEQQTFRETARLESVLREQSEKIGALESDLKKAENDYRLAMDLAHAESQKRLAILAKEHSDNCQAIETSLESQYRANYLEIKQNFESMLSTAEQNYQKLENEHSKALKKLSTVEEYKKKLQHQMVTQFQSLLTSNYEDLLSAVQAAENGKFNITEQLSRSLNGSNETLTRQLLETSQENLPPAFHPSSGQTQQNTANGCAVSQPRNPAAFVSSNANNQLGRGENLPHTDSTRSRFLNVASGNHSHPQQDCANGAINKEARKQELQAYLRMALNSKKSASNGQN